MSLSAYEQQEWERLQLRKEASLQKRARNLLPEAARDRLVQVADMAKAAPGSETVAAAYTAVAGGLGKVTGSTAKRTVSPKRVVKQFQRAGHAVDTLADIKLLDLKEIDSVAKLGRIRYGHALTAAVGGLGSGAVVTGGELLVGAGTVVGAGAGTGAAPGPGTVAGAGAGAAPGLGTVASAVAVDAAGVLALAARSVAATALYYGYDPDRPEEEVFMMSVIGLGMASNAAGKTAAYAELSQLTQLLARSAPWAKLNEKILTRIAQKFATKFGQTLTKRKLGQFVPIAGMAVGAGLNYLVIDQVSTAAYDAYRERFLIEKSGGTLTRPSPADSPPLSPAEDGIDVIALLEDEGLLDDPENP